MPLFKKGSSPFLRLLLLVCCCAGLILADARYRVLDEARRWLGSVIYPLERAALAPKQLFDGILSSVQRLIRLEEENQILRSHNLNLSYKALRADHFQDENSKLRALLELKQRPGLTALPVEVLYDVDSSFATRSVVNKGAVDGVQTGAPAISEQGLVGQVTRVYPYHSELTLITDRNQAVPVQFARTGMRAVLYGTIWEDQLEARFVSTSADVIANDILVTSGLDQLFPPGLPVARVLRVDRPRGFEFAQISAVPLATIKGSRQLLLLLQPRPKH